MNNRIGGNKMKIIKVVSLLTLVSLLLSGCSTMREAKGGEEVIAEAATVTEAIPAVTQVLSAEAVDQEIYTFGYLEPNETYFATPYSGGVVESIEVAVGDRVEKDALLYKLEEDNVTAAKDKDLLQKESSVVSAKSNYDLQALNLKQREGDLEVRDMSLNSALKNYDSSLELFAEGIISQLELDNALNSYDQAMISYNQAQLTYESTQLSYTSALNAYKDAQENETLAVKDYQGQYSDLSVLAPIDGLVTDVTVQKGLMNQGSTGVTLIDDTRMVLKVNIMEKYIQEIKIGQTVRLELDYMDEAQIATVAKISLTANKGYYPVEIEIPNGDGKLTSGMYAEGFIQVNRIDKALLVNKTSIVTDEIGDGTYVYILGEDGESVEKVSVELGLEKGEKIQIIGDVKVGDEVVVIGQEYLSVGSLIKK